MSTFPFLAQVDNSTIEVSAGMFSKSGHEVVVIICAVIGLAAFFCLIAFLRGPRKRSRGITIEPQHSRSLFSRMFGKKRRRRKKRSHSGVDEGPRNPTLAEAGGLPPLREDGRPPAGP